MQELLGQQFVGGLEDGLGRTARVADPQGVQQGRGHVLQRVGPVDRLDEVEDHGGRPFQQLPADRGQVQRAGQRFGLVAQSPQALGDRLDLDHRVLVFQRGFGRNGGVEDDDTHG